MYIPKTKYLHTSKVTIFLFNISMSLPGVATMIWTPFLITSIDSELGTPVCIKFQFKIHNFFVKLKVNLNYKSNIIPPIARQVRNSGRPSTRCRWFAKYWIFSRICLANSREGQTIRPYGPSFLVKGSLFSCSIANIIMGRTKTNVFPLPV